MGLDTNFRIFFEIFRRFQEITKTCGFLEQLSQTEKVLRKGRKMIFYNFYWAVFTTFSFLAISEAYVLFTTGQRYYRPYLKTYKGKKTHLLCLFWAGVNHFVTCFMQLY